MKITKARLKQIIMEELQNEGGGRGEGSMADSQLNRIADLAKMIDDLVSDETNLEEWVESKITMAQAYLSAVLNYLKGNMADAGEDEMGGEEDEEDMPMPDYEASPLEKFLTMQSRGKSLTDLDEDMLEEET